MSTMKVSSDVLIEEPGYTLAQLLYAPEKVKRLAIVAGVVGPEFFTGINQIDNRQDMPPTVKRAELAKLKTEELSA